MGNKSGEIDLRAVVARLWAGRLWLIVSTFVFTAAITTATFFMTPMYRASTVLVESRPEGAGLGSLSSALGQLGGLAALTGINLGTGDSRTEESLAVLRSREFSENFIRDRQLMPVLFYKRWDAANNGWRGAQDTWPTLAQAFKYFDESVRSVSRDPLTGLVTLDIEWNDPEIAADWANTLISRLNAEMRAREIASTSASVGYLEAELTATSPVEVKQAISRLIEAQINRRMIANVTQEFAFRVVDKAMAPDPEDVVSPNRLILLPMGMVLGLFFGIVLVLLRHEIAAGRAEG